MSPRSPVDVASLPVQARTEVLADPVELTGEGIAYVQLDKIVNDLAHEVRSA